MTDPGLAGHAKRGDRRPDTFWSSRGMGPLVAEKGEAVFIVPDEVLRRFVGKERLFYAVATFPDRTRSNPQVMKIDPATMPFVTLSPSLNPRASRRLVGVGSVGTRWSGGEHSGGAYSTNGGASLEWAGDIAAPGTEPLPEGGDAAAGNGGEPSGEAENSSVPSAAASFAYSDGFSDDLWQEQPRQSTRGVRAFEATPFGVAWSGVSAVPATHGTNSWTAAATTLLAWVERNGVPLPTAGGAMPSMETEGDPGNVAEFAAAWGLVPAAGASLSVGGLRDLLASTGPLWVAQAGSPHAVVVSGVSGDGTAEGTMVRIHDPWMATTPPAEPMPSSGGTDSYERAFRDFVGEFGASEAAESPGIHVLHLKEGTVSGIPSVRTQGLSQVRSSLERRQRAGQLQATARAQAAPAIVPIVSTIVGATMTRVMNNTGDVTWELDQLNGLKHPADDSARAGSANYTTAPILRVEGWPRVEAGGVDAIYADFEVRWQYNGHSLGNIEINPLHTNDALAWGLQVKANITNDATVYEGDLAAVRVLFHYRFTRTVGPDGIAVREYRLYGDGTVEEIDSRWTQQPEGWTSTEQGVRAGQQGLGPVIVGPIVNTLLQMLTGSLEDDITFELPKLTGWKYVDNNSANKGTGGARVQTATVKGPSLVNGKRVGLDLVVTWNYDGRSVGDVSVRAANPGDALGWGLAVVGAVHDDPGTYPSNEGSTCAAIRLAFSYQFDAPPYYDDVYKNMDVIVYGDGTHARVLID
jgi:hypothetical protein